MFDLTPYFRVDSSGFRVITHLSLEALLAKRSRDCHKTDFGHVLVIGGNYGMPGSVCLAAEAALRIGAGVVTVATRELFARQALPGLAEALVYGIRQSSDLEPLLAKASVVVIGPGLGLDDWALALFKKARASKLPLIVDASALRLLALAKDLKPEDNQVLTPHPGEAAQLLAFKTQEIQASRGKAIELLQERFGGNIVLKGFESLIRGSDGMTYLCPAGNPGMASAGMGDVLTGVIAGLVAQGLSLNLATIAGVWLHAKAGDLAVEKAGERGLLARDLMPYLRFLVNHDL